MLFKKSKDNLMKETVIISCANQVLFEGLLKEIPLLEESEKELLEDKWLCLIQYTPFTDITDVKFSK